MSPRHGHGRPLPGKRRKLSHEEKKVIRTKLFSVLKPYIEWIIFATVLLITTSILQIVAPLVLKEMTNEIASSLYGNTIDLDFVTTKGITMACIYVVNALFAFTASFTLVTISERFSKKLRTDIAEKINRLPLSYFDTTQHGDILSRLTNDVDSMGQSIQQSITSLIQALFLLVGVLAAMFYTSWQLALVVVATLPLMLVSLFFMNFFAMPKFHERQHVLGEVEAIAEENYSGQLIIKAFSAEKRANEGFNEKNAKLGRTMFMAEFWGGFMEPLMNFISYLAYAAVCIVGGLLLSEGTAGMDYGVITAFLVFVNLFQQPLSTIAQSMNNLQSGIAASTRVFDFLGQKEMEDESEKIRRLGDSVRGEVEFKNVAFGYDDTREIIHDFTAKVKPGMKVAIVGPTGAGKTTMVNLLMRFYDVKSGAITIDGVNLADMKREEIHDVFAMVLQDTWVFEGTLRENLVYNTKDVTDEDIAKVLDDIDLTHYVDTLPGKLDFQINEGDQISGGEKQLLTIARAMLKKAPLLILDEATSNVDTRTEERIQKAMDKLMEGKTSFVIAHRLSTIKNADLILVMKDGNIIEQGNHDSLMTQNGFYTNLYNSQFAL